MKKATLEIIAKLLKGEEVKDPETATPPTRMSL